MWGKELTGMLLVVDVAIQELDRSGSCGSVVLRRQFTGSAQIPPLKGGQNSAQGFNPGLGILTRCALKGHSTAVRRFELVSCRSASSFWRHFQGAFFDGRYPGLKPWAEILSPFRGKIRLGSLKSTPAGARPQVRHFRYSADSRGKR